MRPTLLVAESERENALSVRKLVLETAKFNVITAYTAREAVETFLTFPGVSAAVLTSNIGPENECELIARQVKQSKPQIPVIYLSPTGMLDCHWADYQMSTYEPEELLTLVRKLFGDPRQDSPAQQ